LAEINKNKSKMTKLNNILRVELNGGLGIPSSLQKDEVHRNHVENYESDMVISQRQSSYF